MLGCWCSVEVPHLAMFFGFPSAAGRPGLCRGLVAAHIRAMTWADTVVTHGRRGRHELLSALNARLWDKSQLSAPAKCRSS